MKTVTITLTPRDEAAKTRLSTWALKSEKGGPFKKEFTVSEDRSVITFKMVSFVDMPEKMIRKLLDPIIYKYVIDKIDAEKINTGISILYQ